MGIYIYIEREREGESVCVCIYIYIPLPATFSIHYLNAITAGTTLGDATTKVDGVKTTMLRYKLPIGIQMKQTFQVIRVGYLGGKLEVKKKQS